MTEVLFYQLDRKPLNDFLPELLEKTLERGQRAVVRAGSDERVEALDTHLWTFRLDGFLPHGAKADGFAERQPVYLTAKDENPNSAQVAFFVDGTLPADWSRVAGFARAVVVFDGNDKSATDAAREAWSRAKTAGHDVTFWKQSPQGKWEKQA